VNPRDAGAAERACELGVTVFLVRLDLDLNVQAARVEQPSSSGSAV